MDLCFFFLVTPVLFPGVPVPALLTYRQVFFLHSHLKLGKSAPSNIALNRDRGVRASFMNIHHLFGVLSLVIYVCVSRSVMSNSATPWTVVCQAPLSMEFFRQEYWSGLPFPSPGNLPDPEIEPGSPALQADSLRSEPPGKPEENHCRLQGQDVRERSEQLKCQEPAEYKSQRAGAWAVLGVGSRCSGLRASPRLLAVLTVLLGKSCVW